MPVYDGGIRANIVILVDKAANHVLNASQHWGLSILVSELVYLADAA